nr:MAG TPA: hypothetical protein [Caudoviricetes sp.]
MRDVFGFRKSWPAKTLFDARVGYLIKSLNQPRMLLHLLSKPGSGIGYKSFKIENI